MSISDEELTRQLEAVPLVDPPDFREDVLRQLEDKRSRLSGQAGLPVLHRSRRVLVGLAWAAAAVIVIGVAIQRASMPRQQSAAAAIAPLPVEEWPIVQTMVSPDGPTVTVRRNRDRFAIQPVVPGKGPLSIAWDQEKLTTTDLPKGVSEITFNDRTKPLTVILQRRRGASGTAAIRLSVAGREVFKTTIGID
jgi:hypothetical protein